MIILLICRIEDEVSLRKEEIKLNIFLSSTAFRKCKSQYKTHKYAYYVLVLYQLIKHHTNGKVQNLWNGLS